MRTYTLCILLHLMTFPGGAQKKAPVIDSSVTIKNSKIYYYERGRGNTPVVFVSGLGDDHATWETVQDSIAAYTTTISYDRSGLGKSAYNHEKKDLRSITEELKDLIWLTKIARPFILVGHSLGCQIVKEFAALYPASVKAIVFIDPGYNEEALRANVTDSMWREREKALQKYLPVFNAAQKEELRNANRAATISDSTRISLNIQVILFTATHVNLDFPCSQVELNVKKASHSLWLKNMPQAIHIFEPASRHYIQNDQPSVIIKAIISMLP